MPDRETSWPARAVADLTDQTRRQSEASMAARGMTADLDRPDGGD
jgi:hypothetical protein